MTLEALAAAGAALLQSFELGPADLATVRRCLPEPIVAAALLFVEFDPTTRWANEQPRRRDHG